MASSDESHDCDVLIVGGGIAGLSAALGLTGRRVTVLSKVPVSPLSAGGSSVWAQGGIAAALGADDSPALHARDTVDAAAGLAVPAGVTALTEEGPRRVLELIALGARFDRGEGGRIQLGREAAHSRRRILHSHGDATGSEIVRTLMAAVEQAPHVDLRGEVAAQSLVAAQGRVGGVVAQEKDGRRVVYRAPAVVLATGGLGRLYLHTTNPPENTGDGLAMAARAGARLVDLEFVQFHPTALAVPGADPMPLLTEALRGEGAILVDEAGQRFMVAEHPQAELAPRDVVARAIWRRQRAGHQVFLDAREAVGEAFPDRFPTVFELCSRHGLDPRNEALPVAPAAHFHMGGVATDELGRTSLAGLWACGEVASTGVHGANRLASNSLLEGLVYGGRVAADVGHNLDLGLQAPVRCDPPASGATGKRAAGDEEDLVLEVRRLMWEEVGVERSEAGLRRALRQLDRLAWWLPTAGPQLGSLITVARLVAGAALERRESRGGHYRSDYPRPRTSWRRRLFFTASEGALVAAPPWPEPVRRPRTRVRPAMTAAEVQL